MAKFLKIPNSKLHTPDIALLTLFRKRQSAQANHKKPKKTLKQNNNLNWIHAFYYILLLFYYYYIYYYIPVKHFSLVRPYIILTYLKLPDHINKEKAPINKL